MKALVYEGPGKKAFKDVPKPTLKLPTDVIVKLTYSTICGTDLHILKGDVPEMPKGAILGHEGVGIVEEVGSAVSNFKKGDKVIISCVTSCGKCDNCKIQFYSHCENGGWIFGHLIDGTQAEYIRVPYGDNSLYHIPAGMDEKKLVLLSDIFPTGYEIGVLNGAVKPGDVVAIVGSGPVGLAAMMTAQFYSPSKIIMIDLDDNRLKVAKEFGATDSINSKTQDVFAEIKRLTNGQKVDVAIEAVGTPKTFDICQNIVRAKGHLACVGVFGEKVDLHLEKLWIENITLTTGLVSTYTTSALLKNVISGKLKPEKLITHNFKFSEIDKAYEVFGNAAEYKALKVILEF